MLIRIISSDCCCIMWLVVTHLKHILRTSSNVW